MKQWSVCGTECGEYRGDGGKPAAAVRLVHAEVERLKEWRSFRLPAVSDRIRRHI